MDSLAHSRAFTNDKALVTPQVHKFTLCLRCRLLLILRPMVRYGPVGMHGVVRLSGGCGVAVEEIPQKSSTCGVLVQRESSCDSRS